MIQTWITSLGAFALAGTMALAGCERKEGTKMSDETEAHKSFAAELNGKVWDLLAKANRTKAEDEVMVHAAHASCYHWLQAGTPVHHQRGEWLIAHVYSELGRSEPALYHARRCADLTQEHKDEMKDFDLAYAWEGLARAHAAAGNKYEAQKYYKMAQEAGQAIQGAEDKKIFLGDLEGGNWQGLR